MNGVKSQSNRSSGQLLALLTASFYAIFTLMPDSHSLMVFWPWVFVWQVALLCPILWLLGIIIQNNVFPQLSHQIDGWVGFVVLSFILTTLFAELPNPARWHSWAALGFIAALYALNHEFNHSQARYSALRLQGYLSIAFILTSLLVWTTQTVLPELDRLEALRSLGLTVSFDASSLQLRNWAPIGHQNYVAGYLVLSLPLLAALAFLESGWRRLVFFGGVALGLVDLYTTSSRGGWLGLFAVALGGFAIALLRSSIPKLWLFLSGIGMILFFFLFLLANTRLRSIFLGILSGKAGGQLAYRFITMTTGWEMGKSDLLTGVGGGNVPWLYQQYLPTWGGTEAEVIYQLHSTPVQIFAEWGLLGIIAQLSAVVLCGYLFWRWFQADLDITDFIIGGSLFCAIFGYFTLALTDYQLDNIAISGLLVIYLAVIASILRRNPFIRIKYIPQMALAGVGLIIAVLIWLIPLHRAWQVSMQGFTILAQEEVDVDRFVEKLTQAHELAPWESYYSYQLGWNLGEFALQSQNPQQRQILLDQGVNWFEEGLNASRDREFGYSNLGWLQLNQGNPQAAARSFAKSAALLPAKRGVFYGLGFSLLRANQLELAIEALTLEVLRNPLLITSPQWGFPALQAVYPQVVENAIAQCNDLIANNPSSRRLDRYLHQIQGMLFWWQGNPAEARKRLEGNETAFSEVLFRISEGENVSSVIQNLNQSPQQLVLSAWAQPEQRSQLLQQAWLQTRQEIIPQPRLDALLTTMGNSDSFDRWLRENAPSWQYRRQRSGFSVNMRHMGGATPLDYLQVVENIPIAVWFNSLFPYRRYFPDLDLALQPQRQALLNQID